MKKRTCYLLLLLEAVSCFFLFSRQHFLSPELISSALAFPFEPIGLGLRMLSLSGAPGNILAILLYLALCLLPLTAYLRILGKRTSYPEDSLPALLSLLLFFVLYRMINPVSPIIAGVSLDPTVHKVFLSTCTYSVLFSWLILRLLRLASQADAAQCVNLLQKLLYLLVFGFIFSACGISFGTLLSSLASLKEGNTGESPALSLTRAFLFLQYLINALPYLLNSRIALAAIDLAEHLQQDPYSEPSVTAVQSLARLCCRSLAILTTATLCFNLLQLFLANRLLIIRTQAELPLFSAAFVLIILLLARYLHAAQKLKADNDLFI